MLLLNSPATLTRRYGIFWKAYILHFLFVPFSDLLPVSSLLWTLSLRGRPRGIVPVFGVGVLWTICFSKWRLVRRRAAPLPPRHTTARSRETSTDREAAHARVFALGTVGHRSRELASLKYTSAVSCGYVFYVEENRGEQIFKFILHLFSKSPVLNPNHKFCYVFKKNMIKKKSTSAQSLLFRFIST